MKTILVAQFLVFLCFSLNAQSSISYTFDKQGRMTSEKLENNYDLKYSYDKEGNIISKSVTDITGIEIMKISNENKLFKVYPNPTNKNVTVEVLENNFNQEITICDILGNVLAKKVIINSHTQFSLEGFGNGIYYLLIKSGRETVPFKIIKN